MVLLLQLYVKSKEPILPSSRRVVCGGGVLAAACVSKNRQELQEVSRSPYHTKLLHADARSGSLLCTHDTESWVVSIHTYIDTV